MADHTHEADHPATYEAHHTDTHEADEEEADAEEADAEEADAEEADTEEADTHAAEYAAHQNQVEAHRYAHEAAARAAQLLLDEPVAAAPYHEHEALGSDPITHSPYPLDPE